MFSEDQGVYCLATGTSFSLTSNISSVTSQLVDGNCDNSSIDENVNKSPLVYSNVTKLSLFDLTPKPVNRIENRRILNANNEEEVAVVDNYDFGMNTWVYSNYVSNCMGGGQQRREKISLSDENESIDSIESSASPSSFIQVNNECII